jgi:predicted permease
MLASLAGKKKITPRMVVMEVLAFPAVFALVAALLFVGFQAPIPEFIPGPFNTYVAPIFFSLMLLLVGYKIQLVDPRKYFGELTTVGTFRFVVSPIITYIIIVALGMSLTVEAEPTSPPPSLLMAAMPPALFNVILASNFNLDTKFYGALVFYLTLVSLLLVLPIMSMFIF